MDRRCPRTDGAQKRRREIDASTPARLLHPRTWIGFSLLLACTMFACTMFACTMLGCAQWRPSTSENDSDSASSRNPLPRQRMSADTVVLEVTTITVPAAQKTKLGEKWSESLWNQLDETALPIDLRRRLRDNGLRAGIASSQLPPQLEKLLVQHEDRRELESQLGHQAFQAESSHQRWQTRMAQPKRYTLTPVQPQLTWLIDEAGYLIGESVKQAQCQVEVTTYPEPDGAVRLDLLPLIEHGEPKQTVDVSEQSFVMKVERQRKDFAELEISAELVAGQTLVLTQTSENAGLGHVFFGSDAEGRPAQRILLIRLAQTQLDNLFSREQIFAPIETPTD